MQRIGTWAGVVGFLLLGIGSLWYLFTEMGEVTLGYGGTYAVYADFTNASGLDPGSGIEIAGVPVGQVTGIELVDGRARVRLNLRSEIRLQEDAIASIQTKGLLGGRYIVITPGGSDQLIPAGGKIRETESPLDLPGLIATYVNMRNKARSSPAKPAPIPP
ncbi:MAG: MlaD family protein [Candidatus Binatia bacterium]|nr:MlaD family protein [Candidatus Binatia bacterium]